MRKLFAALVLLAAAAHADDISFRSIQSGWDSGETPLFDHGIYGQRQIIAILDTGLDWDSCYFAEPDGSAPPVNTGSPQFGLSSSNVDPNRRKVIAYDFLYSCDQFPNAFGCDDPRDPTAYDNARHGTINAAVAAGDAHTPLIHDDAADGIAPGAKLIVQDGGFIGGDNCSQRPGFGCPVSLTPILEQVYKQGARIHSNSWGDRQGTSSFLPPPTANYSASARDVDDFVWSHPDMLVVFDTGNSSTSSSAVPASTVAAPGCAKNTLQIGGTRVPGSHLLDDVLAPFSLIGPTRDGRIKPDLVAPAVVLAGNSDGNVTLHTCPATVEAGTSWSAPSVAGAAALVRQYFTDGFYPTGVATQSNAFVPSAALLKATLIAAGRAVPNSWINNNLAAAKPVPSYDQGFGFPVLDDALYFPGDRSRMRVADVPLLQGLAQGETATLHVNVSGNVPLKVVLVWTDPAGVPRGVSDPTPELVNDLDLRVTTPTGTTLLGNDPLHPGQPDRLNNVEMVSINAPIPGPYTISITAPHLGSGTRQSYALVITGDFTDAIPPMPNPSARTRAARR